MTDIDFYILPENTMAARDHFACRLAEKALSIGRQVVIHVNDQDHGESISQYLWSFKPESFVPNTCITASENTSRPQSTPEKVLIDWQGHISHYHDVLINLTSTIPQAFSQFEKLSEIVVQDEELLSITRSHFQFYRDRGYPLKSHDMRQ